LFKQQSQREPAERQEPKSTAEKRRERQELARKIGESEDNNELESEKKEHT